MPQFSLLEQTEKYDTYKGSTPIPGHPRKQSIREGEI